MYNKFFYLSKHVCVFINYPYLSMCSCIMPLMFFFNVESMEENFCLHCVNGNLSQYSISIQCAAYIVRGNKHIQQLIDNVKENDNNTCNTIVFKPEQLSAFNLPV